MRQINRSETDSKSAKALRRILLQKNVFRNATIVLGRGKFKNDLWRNSID